MAIAAVMIGIIDIPAAILPRSRYMIITAVTAYRHATFRFALLTSVEARSRRRRPRGSASRYFLVCGTTKMRGSWAGAAVADRYFIQNDREYRAGPPRTAAAGGFHRAGLADGPRLAYGHGRLAAGEEGAGSSAAARNSGSSAAGRRREAAKPGQPGAPAGPDRAARATPNEARAVLRYAIIGYVVLRVARRSTAASRG